MTVSRYEPDAVFEPASAGARLRLATMVSLVVGALVPLVALVVILNERRPAPWPALLAPAAAPLVLAAVWIFSRIGRYRVSREEIVVELAVGARRFALAGLQSVTPDPAALRGAHKLVGNDGLGALSGRFRSQHLGTFRAYLTDDARAVVLRWPDCCLVISPQQHSLFVDTVRRRAGLSS